MNNEDARTSKIGLILGNVVGWWGLLYVVFRAVARRFILEESWAGPFTWVSIDILLATVVSSVVAAIVVVISIRHLPVARPFLRKFVAFLLLMTLLGGGFYFCATAAHEGTLWSCLSTSLNTGSQADPSPRISPPIQILSIPYSTISNGRWNLIDSSNILLALIFPFASMTALPCFLLMLITPSFLALPVFWLLGVLGLLYVVLPQRAWGWAKDRAKSIRRSTG
ncbi:MAG: hypothetical protein C0398_02395 [Coprothermobacter sp.]|nr:hypothetical protein [Coprothermobacter sp.]